jgi:hypothetical protein
MAEVSAGECAEGVGVGAVGDRRIGVVAIIRCVAQFLRCSGSQNGLSEIDAGRSIECHSTIRSPYDRSDRQLVPPQLHLESW